jgi:uncharacterized membrane protein
MERVDILLKKDGIAVARYKVKSVLGKGFVNVEEELQLNTELPISADALIIQFEKETGTWIITPVKKSVTYDDYREKYQLTSQERKILDLLQNSEKPLTQREIAEQMGIKPQGVWHSLQRLLEKGLIKKTDDRPAKYFLAR